MAPEPVEHILLVEDDFIIAMEQERALRDYGYSVTIAESGEKAIAWMEAPNSFSLILMDIDLGEGMDGTEAAKLILAKQDLPIVFVSSHTEPSIVTKTESISSYGYVVKNTGITILDASIKMAMRLFHARQKLSRSEKMLREAESIANSGGYELSVTMGWWESSEELDRIFGIDEGYDRSVEGWADLIHPEDRASMMAYFADEVIGKRQLFDRRYRIIRRRDGAERLVHGLGRLELDSRGEPTIMYGMIQDITSQSETAQALEDRQKEQELGSRILNYHIDNSPLATVEWDSDFVVTRWAGEAENMFGWTAEETLGKSLGDLNMVYEEDLPIVKETMARLTNSSLTKVVSTNRNVRKDGRILTCEWYNSTIFDAEGRMVSVLSQVLDISGRLALEKALRESGETYRNYVEKASEGILVVDSQGRFIEVNQAACSLSGYEREELLSLSLPDISVYDDGELPLDILKRALSEGGVRLERKYRRKDGSIRDWSVRSVRLEEGRVMGLAHDITEDREKEQRISRLLAEKELILREAHHRIKNNMSTMTSLVFLHRQSLIEPSAIEALLDVESRLKSMLVLYDRLNKSEDFKQIAAREYLPSLVGEIMRNFPGSRTVRLETEIADFRLDSRKLHTLGIIINEVTTNIMKYAFKGSEDPVIKLAAGPTESGVLLSIKDNGVGMPDGVDFDSSTGFGLTLIRELTRQIGGSIRIERSCGTKILLEFPA